MVRKLNLTRGENLIKKPHSYARDSKKEASTDKIIKHLTNTKGINTCYNLECESNNIIYDPHRDETYCRDCGTVLRRGLEDYQDTINYNGLKDQDLTPVIEPIDYYQDLMKQTEIEVIGTI